jgi:hypothetical protein
VNQLPRATDGAELDGSQAASAFSTVRATSWFISQGGKTEGPLSAERITQLIRWGKVSKRAYVCDEQLSSWVSIRRTAFAAVFTPRVRTPQADRRGPESEVVPRLGALRGGPWRLSTRAAQRLSGLLAALSVAAGALQLASGLAMSSRAEVAPSATPAPR